MGATAQKISAPTAIAMPLTMRLLVSANVEANGHGEIEGFTGHVRRRRRKRLRTPHRVDCFLIKCRETRGPDHPARQNFSISVERKCEFSCACLVPRSRGRWIAFVPLDLQGDPAMP